MKLLIFGGSFNPPHIGHLAMADHARRQFGYEKVILVPSFRPPHKTLSSDPGPAHRLAMVESICLDDPHFIADPCEIRREGTSYTIDTIRELRSRYPIEGKPGLLLGDDLIPGFASWKDSEAVAEESDIICAHRGEAAELVFPYAHRYADNPLIPVSSSLIRSLMAGDKAFRYLLPGPVFHYIEINGLYGLA